MKDVNRYIVTSLHRYIGTPNVIVFKTLQGFNASTIQLGGSHSSFELRRVYGNARGEEQLRVYAASSCLSVRVPQLRVQPCLGKSPVAPHGDS